MHQFSRLLLALLIVLGQAAVAHGFWPLAEWPARPAPQESTPAPRTAAPSDTPPDSAARLQERIHVLALALQTNLDNASPARPLLDEGLAITTFVELKKLYRSSSFGRYLADQLLNEFQQLEYRVVELRKSRSILMVEKHGEHGLSRDPAELQPAIEAGAVLTGTYTTTPDSVLVNARIIANDSNVLLASATMAFVRNELVDYLLTDRSSAGPGSHQSIYVKELGR